MLLLSFESFGWKAKAHLYFAEEALKDALDNDSVTLLAPVARYIDSINYQYPDFPKLHG